MFTKIFSFCLKFSFGLLIIGGMFVTAMLAVGQAASKLPKFTETVQVTVAAPSALTKITSQYFWVTVYEPARYTDEYSNYKDSPVPCQFGQVSLVASEAVYCTDKLVALKTSVMPTLVPVATYVAPVVSAPQVQAAVVVPELTDEQVAAIVAEANAQPMPQVDGVVNIKIAASNAWEQAMQPSDDTLDNQVIAEAMADPNAPRNFFIGAGIVFLVAVMVMFIIFMRHRNHPVRIESRAPGILGTLIDRFDCPRWLAELLRLPYKPFIRGHNGKLMPVPDALASNEAASYGFRQALFLVAGIGIVLAVLMIFLTH